MLVSVCCLFDKNQYLTNRTAIKQTSNKIDNII